MFPLAGADAVASCCACVMGPSASSVATAQHVDGRYTAPAPGPSCIRAGHMLRHISRCQREQLALGLQVPLRWLSRRGVGWALVSSNYMQRRALRLELGPALRPRQVPSWQAPPCIQPPWHWCALRHAHAEETHSHAEHCAASRHAGAQAGLSGQEFTPTSSWVLPNAQGGNRSLQGGRCHH